MLTRSHQIALVDRALEHVLALPTDDGLRLPRVDDRWPDHRGLVAAVGSPDAFLAGEPWREDDGTVTNVLVGDLSALEHAAWHPLDELAALGVSDEGAEAIRRILREWREGPPEDGRAAWFRPGWKDAVEAWVEEVLPQHGYARRGDVEAVKVWSLSAVLRFPVVRDGEGSDLWFKATCDGFHAEPALTQAVCQLEPDLMPRVLAVEPDHAWMLMETIDDAGDGVDPARAADVARALARLQLETLDRLDVLRAAGAPDRGLTQTLAWLHTVVHESVELPQMTPEQRAAAEEIEPVLADMLREFWSLGIPDALAHGDLHLGNVAWVVDRPVFFDWTDACVSHPFLDVRHLANDASRGGEDDEDKERRRRVVWDAYAEPWRAAYPDLDLDAAWEQSFLVDGVFQMISYEQIYRAQPESSRWELATVVVDTLDKLVEQVRGR